MYFCIFKSNKGSYGPPKSIIHEKSRFSGSPITKSKSYKFKSPKKAMAILVSFCSYEFPIISYDSNENVPKEPNISANNVGNNVLLLPSVARRYPGVSKDK